MSNNKKDSCKPLKKQQSSSSPMHGGPTKAKFEGMTPACGAIFDYKPTGVDTLEFAKSREKIRTYIHVHYGGRNAHIIDNLVDDVEAPPTEPPAIEFDDAYDPIGTKKRLYMKKLDAYAARASAFEDNKSRVFGLIWGQCADALKSKLRDRGIGLSGVSTNAMNPLQLWTEIVQLTLHSGGEDARRVNPALYEYESRAQLTNLPPMKIDEEVSDFFHRFNVNVQALTAKGFRLTPQLEIPADLTELQKANIVELQVKKEDEMLAQLFLKKLNRTRYANMNNDLEIRLKSYGEDHYPKSLIDAYTLAQGRQDARYKPQIHGTSSSKNAENGVSFTTTNNGAAGKGNSKNSAKPKDTDSESNGAKSQSSNNANRNTNNKKKIKCYFCDQEGHVKDKCELLKKAAKIFGVQGDKCVVTMGSSSRTTEEAIDDASVTFTLFCSPAIAAAASNGILRQYDILCDNQSSVSIFKDARLISNIRPAKRTMFVTGIGGTIPVNMVGDLKNFGEVYYHPQSIANILSYFELTERFRVEYDSSENVFQVNVSDTEVWTFEPRNKLYVYNPVLTKNATTLATTGTVQTVKDNLVGFTKSEVKRANDARELWKILAYPSIKDFLWMLNNGKVLGTQVTTHDVNRMIKIFGIDPAVLKGRVTKKQAEQVVIETIEKQYSGNITLAVDIMFIDGLAFLTTVSRRLQLITVVFLDDRSQRSVQLAIDSVIASYKVQSYIVNVVVSDGESAISALKTYLESKGVMVNPTSKNEHVPEVERAIRLIKERVRIIWHSLPYRLCDILLKYLVQYCVSMINHCPKSSSINPGMSPREMFLGVKTDAKRDFKIGFGSYVQVHDDNMVTNTMAARTTGAIALGSSGNAQGTYRFLNLNTWKILHRRNWTALPMPSEVINWLNSKAAKDRNPQMLASLPRFSIGEVDIEEVDDDGSDDSPSNQQVVVKGDHYDGNGHDDDLNEEKVVQTEDQRYEDDDADNRRSKMVTFAEPIENEMIVSGSSDLVSQQDNTFVETENTIIEDNCGVAEQQEEAIIEEDEDDAVQHPFKKVYELRKNRSSYKNVGKDYVTAVAFTTYSVKQGTRQLGIDAIVSMMSELRQLHRKGVFKPIRPNVLSFEKRRKVLRTIMFLKKKRDGRIKSRLVADGSRQKRSESVIDDVSSPTVSTEGIFTQAIVIAEEGRLVAVVDVEGAYLHADMPGEVIVELDSNITSIMTAIEPYYIEFKENDKLYLFLLKALYGCIESAKLFYGHISGTLTAFGFDVNPYDRCVFNKMYFGKQCTVIIHVDDLMISCVDSRAIKSVIDHLEKVYTKVNGVVDQRVEYLGMDFDFSVKGLAKIGMGKMVDAIVHEWNESDTGTVKTPATANLFEVSADAQEVQDRAMKDKFHSTVAKLLYTSKRGRADILLAVNYLTTRVSSPTVEDIGKLDRVIKYLRGTLDLKLHLSATNGRFPMVQAYIDASYAVHKDAKSHTGVVITFGGGAVYCKSTKQKVVSKSSTEAELVGISDGLTQVLWTRLFLEAQGYNVGPAVLYQDNKSTITLAEKGCSNSGRTRHVNIRYFFVKDKIESQEVRVEYKPTEDMVADFMTKPLQGQQFIKLRNMILGMANH
jgi:hypothetical protein